MKHKSNSKAQGHVEIILSFIIFISFLLFLMVFMNPFAKSKQDINYFDNARDSIIKNITLKVNRISIIENETNGCYNITLQLKNKYGNNYREVAQCNRRYHIYFSDFFVPGSPNENKKCGPKNYTLGAYSKEKIIAYEKIVELNQSYNANYKNLKKHLGISRDFLFKIKDMQGNELGLSVDRQVSRTQNVNAKEIPIRVIDSNGEFYECILNIMIW